MVHLFSPCQEAQQLVIESDFPFWLRYAHFINLIFITLLIRSGIEILNAHPKLYWNAHAKPSTEWIKFTRRFQKTGYGLEYHSDYRESGAGPGPVNEASQAPY
jgi:hypothetical protein